MFSIAIRKRNAGSGSRPIILGDSAAPEIAIIDVRVSPPPPIQSPASSSRVGSWRFSRGLPEHSPSNAKPAAHDLLGTSESCAATAAQITSSGNGCSPAAARSQVQAHDVGQQERIVVRDLAQRHLRGPDPLPPAISRNDVNASWIRSR